MVPVVWKGRHDHSWECLCQNGSSWYKAMMESVRAGLGSAPVSFITSDLRICPPPQHCLPIPCPSRSPSLCFLEEVEEAA